LLVVLAGCADQGGAKPLVTGGRQIHTLYLWDADGHTDIALLNALKTETANNLKSHGYTISNDADKTDAYVKITVLDAYRSADKRSAYIKARVYVVASEDGRMLFDNQYESWASGGTKFVAPEYPVDKFVKGVLKGL